MLHGRTVDISVGREYGSGGHMIAEKLAKRLGIRFYDRNLLDEIANEKKLKDHQLDLYDEVPKNHLFSRKVRGYSNSPEEVIARMQFDFLKKKAEKGESFVIVGRCSEDVLKEYPGLISFFIIADMKTKLERVEEVRHMTAEEAEAVIRRHDKKRKAYHDYYCQTKWGDARNYDLTVNCSKLGLEGTTDLLESFIRSSLQKRQ